MTLQRFSVYYYESNEVIISIVYAVDSVNDRFLIADKQGYFKWVKSADCRKYGEYKED